MRDSLTGNYNYVVFDDTASKLHYENFHILFKGIETTTKWIN